jgi:hypothetical protein
MNPSTKESKPISQSHRVLLVGLLLAVATEPSLGQHPPPAGVKFEVISVRVLNDKETAERTVDYISLKPLVVVRLRLSVGSSGLYLYAFSGGISPVRYQVKWVGGKLVWLYGKPEENEHPASPGLEKATHRIPAVWLVLSGHERPALEWEELDSTAQAGEKHAFTVFIKERENDRPKEIISESYVVPSVPPQSK